MLISEQAKQISARIKTESVNPALTQLDELFWNDFQGGFISYKYKYMD